MSDTSTYKLTNIDTDYSMICRKNVVVSTPRSETSIKIAGDIFGLEEFDQNSDKVDGVLRRTSVVAISQVKVLAMSFDTYRKLLFKASVNED